MWRPLNSSDSGQSQPFSYNEYEKFLNDYNENKRQDEDQGDLNSNYMEIEKPPPAPQQPDVYPNSSINTPEIQNMGAGEEMENCCSSEVSLGRSKKKIFNLFIPDSNTSLDRPSYQVVYRDGALVESSDGPLIVTFNNPVYCEGSLCGHQRKSLSDHTISSLSDNSKGSSNDYPAPLDLSCPHLSSPLDLSCTRAPTPSLEQEVAMDLTLPSLETQHRILDITRPSNLNSQNLTLPFQETQHNRFDLTCQEAHNFTLDLTLPPQNIRSQEITEPTYLDQYPLPQVMDSCSSADIPRPSLIIPNPHETIPLKVPSTTLLIKTPTSRSLTPHPPPCSPQQTDPPPVPSATSRPRETSVPPSHPTTQPLLTPDSGVFSQGSSLCPLAGVTKIQTSTCTVFLPDLGGKKGGKPVKLVPPRVKRAKKTSDKLNNATTSKKVVVKKDLVFSKKDVAGGEESDITSKMDVAKNKEFVSTSKQVVAKVKVTSSKTDAAEKKGSVDTPKNDISNVEEVEPTPSKQKKSKKVKWEVRPLLPLKTNRLESTSMSIVSSSDASHLILWNVVIALLRSKDPQHTSIIRWTNFSSLTFLVVLPDKLAELWGNLKGDESITWKKVMRTLIYYMKHKLLKSTGTSYEFKLLEMPSVLAQQFAKERKA